MEGAVQNHQADSLPYNVITGVGAAGLWRSTFVRNGSAVPRPVS